jgi:hypothetical protein
VNVNIGAKRPIDANQVFLVGRCFSRTEPPFVLLYDGVKKRESRRNLRKVAPEELVVELGASGQFVSIEAPLWGIVWFRTAKVREVVEMTPSHLRLSSATFGARVLFDHDPELGDEPFVPGPGFSLYGLTVEQVSESLGRPVLTNLSTDGC